MSIVGDLLQCGKVEPAGVSRASLDDLPIDLLAEITRFVPAWDVLNLKMANRLVKSKMERGGLGSYTLADAVKVPRSPFWFASVSHSRLTELIVLIPRDNWRKVYCSPGMMTQLPNSLRIIRLKFENAMAFLEPLPPSPGVTTALQESYKMMNMGQYFPNLTELNLIDQKLAWKVNDTEELFRPTALMLSTFVAHLPQTLRHLELTPFPTLDGNITDFPPYLLSAHLQSEEFLAIIDLPKTLTALSLAGSLYLPELDYQSLPNLCSLELQTHSPTLRSFLLPKALQKLSVTAAYLLPSFPLPQGLVELNLGLTGVNDLIWNHLPDTLKKLTMEGSSTFDLAKLPRGLVSFCTGAKSGQQFGLGYIDEHLASLPPALESLTLVGLQRLTHMCWFHLPKSLKFLDLTHHSVDSNFVKLLPPNIKEVHVHLLKFTFREGLALISDCPLELNLPDSLAATLLRHLVSPNVIFRYDRAECNINDASASQLPTTLRTLTLTGSHVGITDDFVRALPRSLTSLSMPHQTNLTSRTISYLPPALTSLDLDASVPVPDPSRFPPTLRRVTYNGHKHKR